jgi:RHS repeat-associated protein
VGCFIFFVVDLKKYFIFAVVKERKMLCVYNHNNLPLFFYVENNEMVVKNVENDYYFGYTSTFSANLTYNFYSETTHNGLLNMNGRLYDPVIARVLSPDNLVMDATNAQAYNMYSYARNNPLKYTDPTGNFAFTSVIIGAMIGAFVNVMAQGWSGNAQTPGQIMGAFGIGAFAGSASVGACMKSD